MEKQIVKFILLVLLVISPFAVSAAEVEGLNRAEVAVKTQGPDERLHAYAEALGQVVVKLTGDPQAPARRELKSVFENARKWVQRYHYAALPEAKRRWLKGQGYKRILVVQFDDRAVTQALTEAGMPIWGRTRPQVLLWLAVEDRGARYLLAENAVEELDVVIDEYSKRRGLPVMLPLMDIEDQSKLSFGDVWGDFRENVEAASERYNANAILVGRLYRPNRGGWQARWSLYQNGDVQHWRADGTDQVQVLAAGIDGAADAVAQRYAQVFKPGVSDHVSVAVQDVKSLAGYAKAMKSLDALDVVSQVNVAKVQGDEVFFDLEIRGDLNGLRRAITLGGTLRLADDNQRMMENDQILVYQLLP